MEVFRSRFRSWRKRGLLEEDVYDHLHLGRGIPQAISTTIHYAVLFLGFFEATAKKLAGLFNKNFETYAARVSGLGAESLTPGLALVAGRFNSSEWNNYRGNVNNFRNNRALENKQQHPEQFR